MLLVALLAACAIGGKQTMGGSSGRLGGIVGSSARQKKAAAMVVQVRVAPPTLGKKAAMVAAVPDNAMAIMAQAFEDAAQKKVLEQQVGDLQAQVLALQAERTARTGASSSTATNNTRSSTALMQPPVTNAPARVLGKTASDRSVLASISRNQTVIVNPKGNYNQSGYTFQDVCTLGGRVMRKKVTLYNLSKNPEIFNPAGIPYSTMARWLTKDAHGVPRRRMRARRGGGARAVQVNGAGRARQHAVPVRRGRGRGAQHGNRAQTRRGQNRQALRLADRCLLAPYASAPMPPLAGAPALPVHVSCFGGRAAMQESQAGQLAALARNQSQIDQVFAVRQSLMGMQQPVVPRPTEPIVRTEAVRKNNCFGMVVGSAEHKAAKLTVRISEDGAVAKKQATIDKFWANNREAVLAAEAALLKSIVISRTGHLPKAKNNNDGALLEETRAVILTQATTTMPPTPVAPPAPAPTAAGSGGLPSEEAFKVCPGCEVEGMVTPDQHGKYWCASCEQNLD
ncbi:hypothetical protein T492DRAFT_1024267 [Pavlovales sp. CCMP2436]|nr:hypothetical protein T492DRAFT_1024267 [Pavlovales sp. CCMP2436]